MSLHIKDLDYLRAGWQKVVDRGQYGNTIYVFQYDGDKLMAVTNKNQGVGKQIEVITAAFGPGLPPAADGSHGHNRAEPADYTGKPLGS